MIHHKTCIHYIPAFVYLVCFYSQRVLQLDLFHSIILYPALRYVLLFISVYTNLNLNSMFSNTFLNISANFQ